MSALRRAVLHAACPPAALPEQGGWQRLFRFAEDSAVFAGHFPGHPVVPGVVQVLMAQATLEECGQPSELASVPQAKFLAPLGPDADILLTLTPGSREGRWNCILHCGDTVAARMQLEVTAA